MEGLEKYYDLLNAERMGAGREDFNIIVKTYKLHSLTRLIIFSKKLLKTSIIHRASLLDNKRNLYLCG